MKKLGKLNLVVAATMTAQLIIPSVSLGQKFDDSAPVIISNPVVTKPAPAKPAPTKPAKPTPKPQTDPSVPTTPDTSTTPTTIDTAPQVAVTNQRPTIGNIDSSLVTGANCPLVDNQPRQDLLAAAENLSKSIAPLKQCKTTDSKDASNSAEVDSMQSYINSVMQSGKNLRQYVENPGIVSADKSNLKNIQTDVDTLIRGIDQVSQILMKNSLMGGECAKGMMKMTDMIMSLSDLVQAATPYAMMALESNPAFAPAIPFVLGVSGAGNVAKVIKRVSDEKSLDMSDAPTRLAVLQNICEYSRIVQRVRSFNTSKRGDLRDATEQISGYNAFSKKIFSKYSAQAQQVVEMGNKVKEDLNQVKQSAMSDQADIYQLFTEMNAEKDSKLACYIARELVKHANNTAELPTRAIQNMKHALNNRTFLSESARITFSAMLSAEEGLRSKISRERNLDSARALNQCADDGRAYIDALNRLVSSTQNLAITMQARVDDRMIKSQDVEVRNLAKEQYSVQSEKRKIELLQLSASEIMTSKGNASTARVASGKSQTQINTQLLETLNKDNGVIVDANINRNLIDIKLALFGKRDGFLGTPIMRPYSPAFAWYQDTDLLVRKNATDFQKEMRTLRYQAFEYTKTGLRNVTVVDKNGKKRLMNDVEATRQLLDDVKSQQILGPLNIQLLKNGSPAHQQMCLRLNNMLDMWQGTLDHLGSLMFYCSYLRGYMDQTFDPSIVRACQGNLAWTEKTSNPQSDLTKLRQELATTAQDSKLIQSKVSELQCDQF